MNVLVLDAHTNQGLATVRSLGKAGYRVLIASHRALPLGGWSRYASGSFRLERQSTAVFGTLRTWATENKACAVLPMTERSCILLNRERENWERAGIRVGCGPQEMLNQAFDKGETLAIAKTAHVAVPRTATPSSLEEARSQAAVLGFPLIVKSRWSNRWDGAQFISDPGPAYVNSEEQLEKAIKDRVTDGIWPLLQEYVEGVGKGAFALCNRGHVVAWFAHERLRDIHPTGSGSSLRRSVTLDSRLREPSERLLAVMHWHGPAMVEFRDAGSAEPWLMEVNGRFWTSLQLSIDAGVDFPLQWLRILEGKSIASELEYRSGVTLRWLWGDVKRFLYILAGRPSGYARRFPTRLEGLTELFAKQPPETRLEMWRKEDPMPGLGEWVQGFIELVKRP